MVRGPTTTPFDATLSWLFRPVAALASPDLDRTKEVCVVSKTGALEHVHEWEPCGTAQDEQVLYSPVSAMDHVLVTRTLAIRTCKCGAVRKTEVSRKERRLNR